MMNTVGATLKWARLGYFGVDSIVTVTHTQDLASARFQHLPDRIAGPRNQLVHYNAQFVYQKLVSRQGDRRSCRYTVMTWASSLVGEMG